MASRSQDLTVFVIGGGPAGLTAASELARRGIEVTVIEKEGFAGTRVGEHIGPSTVQRLREMGLADAVDPKEHLPCSGIDAWWGSSTPNHNDYLRHPVGFGLNLSRPRFDASLARLCRRRGARILAPARVIRASLRKGGWDLEVAIRGKLLRQQPKYVIDASGRSAAFARMQGGRSSATGSQIAFIAVARRITDAGSPSARVTVESTKNGWWYFAALADARCVCMLVTDPRVYARSRRSVHDWWCSELQDTTQVRRRYAEYEQMGGLLVRSAQSRRLDTLYGPGWVAIGDAAMTFDPLTSQGIAKAVEQGSVAAAAIGRCLDGDGDALAECANTIAARYSDYVTTRTGYYRLEQRWCDAEFWQTTHQFERSRR